MLIQSKVVFRLKIFVCLIFSEVTKVLSKDTLIEDFVDCYY